MAEKAKTADRARQLQAVQEIPCPKCGKPMCIDDLEDQYLLFVREE